MLTRRHIRVKVMQSIYAFIQSENGNIEKTEKFLTLSMNNMYVLYLTLLRLLVEIQEHADKQLTLAQNKYLATVDDKNPKRKFVDNPVFVALRNNSILQKQWKTHNINWELDQSYLVLIYDAIVNSNLYKEYMQSTENSYKKDKAFIVSIYQDIIVQQEKLYEYIEDKQLTWVDDFPWINTFIIKMFKKMKFNKGESTDKLFKDDDDYEFSKQLLQKTLLNYQSLGKAFEGNTPNWDTDRISDIDNILLRMAICEFLNFPSIPVKVTINEYIEIAKEYSTSKSGIFLNGILDKLVKQYSTKNLLNKSGRGLE